MSVFVAGVDPGDITGVAIMSANKIVDAWQDDAWPSIRRLVLWMRENRDAVGLIGLEQAFLGKGAHASLMVAKSSGRVEGALVIAGWNPAKIHWMYPSQWRSELGIKGRKREDAEASARMYAQALAGRPFSVSETHMAEALCMAQVTWSKLAQQQPRPPAMRFRT